MPRPLSKTLSDFNVSTDKIKNEFNKIIKDKLYSKDLKIIFDIAIKDMSLFPNINLDKDADYKTYIERWVKNYEDATLNPPSKRIAGYKASCSDPAIKTIVRYATNINAKEIEEQSKYHNLFMSAENVQGNLLEEFIASKIRKYGWIWCNGNVLRAVDFCSVKGNVLLQIKNKSNTENSSSSAIRDGTAIKKWYRLGTKTKQGKKIPHYKWLELNEIINANTSCKAADCDMSEEAYQKFLRKIAQNNPKIITDL